MRASIIVINKSEEGIAQTLESLVTLPMVLGQDAEIVVVDASEGRFDAIRRRFPVVRWIPFVPLVGRSSIPHQRNRGVRDSMAEIVVFTDASCVPGPDWLEALCGPIWDESETVVAGSHRSPDGGSLRDLATERLGSRQYLHEAPTINLAVRRSVLDELGGFDESFRYGSDVDFTWRAIDAGHRIRYVPEAFVTHEWGGPQDEVRRSYAYGRARARLYIKHPARWRGLFGSDIPVMVYPLLLLAAPVFIRRPYALSVFLIPLARNRGKRPVVTVAEHLVYGGGVLRGVVDWVTSRGRGATR